MVSASSCILAGEWEKKCCSPVRSPICLHWLSPSCWVFTGPCTLPCLFILAALLSNVPVSYEMSLIRKECEKAVYVVILFLFLVKPAADQGLLIMLASEWIFTQCRRKAGKLTRAEIFTVFSKAVVFFYRCSHHPAVQPASSQAHTGYLYAWTALRGIRLPNSLSCSAAEVHWHHWSLLDACWVRGLPVGDDFDTYNNAQRNRRPPVS